MLSRVREMIGDSGWFDVSRSWWVSSYGSLRGFFAHSLLRRPRQLNTTINFDLSRRLYRNESAAHRWGAGFVRPIIDRVVEYVGLPTVSGLDGADEALLNECIRDYWASSLQHAMRDAARDSEAVVRFYQPRIDNKLFTQQDREHGCIEVIPPEMVEILYDPVDKDFILQVIVHHEIEIDERSIEEELAGEPPRLVVHQVDETITPQQYKFFDRSTGTLLDTWTTRNVYGFVPLWKIYNEYSADLGGGQSDLEPVLPFIEAFHDVLDQTLTAHRQHSIPKTKFNVKSVDQFIANNWPQLIDPETGKLRQNATINWEGHEIFFFGPEEDGGFIEAESVLGDSKSLLDFLIDCIAVASETPRWALLASSKEAASNAEVEPFKKKIERKRHNFSKLFVMTCKMALAANNKTPVTVRLNWPPVVLDDLITKGQALQQLILAYDVAAAHGWLADLTIVKMLAEIFPQMNAPEIEMLLAADNKEIAAAPAPASDTQAIPPPAPSTDKNGGGSKKDAQRAVALATTTPSRS